MARAAQLCNDDPAIMAPAIDFSSPFILLDDASESGPARLFANPSAIVSARTPAEIPRALAALRAAGKQGRYAAGFLAYEAAAGLEPRLQVPAGDAPLLWFGLFDAPPRAFDCASLPPNEAGVAAVAPLWSESVHATAVERVRQYIAAGDIYQCNLTFPAALEWRGHPAALFRELRIRQRAGYSALLRHETGWLLSLSPELFFRLDGNRLTARPMKGTAARGATTADDERAAAALASDAKNRAENLMIVDLMRNDLARVARPGSVRVPRLFEIESYPTVHQMTSTVEADLGAGQHAVDVLAALFPCGSVTGTPKLRAMQIIAELEPTPRGAYCGAIGYLAPSGDAAFNVAIRTIAIGANGSANMGLGSAIVADSHPAAEWQECLAKARFLTAAPQSDLIETMRIESGRVVRMEQHLARLAASALRLGYRCDAEELRRRLAALGAQQHSPCIARLLLSPTGAAAIELRPLPPPPAEPVPVALSTMALAADDLRLAHKLTDRAHYDAPRRSSGAFEVLFLDAAGRLTEGSFTSLFVERGARLLTPPLALGLLPGVLRAEMLAQGRAVEAELRPQDLADGFLIGNSARGLLRARLVAPADAQPL